MSPWAATYLAVGAVSLVSLAGAVTLVLGEARVHRFALKLVGFAVGGLFGDALIHILPEAFARSTGSRLEVPLWTLAGFLAFFVLEKVLRWRHMHGELPEDVHPVVWVNLLGDGLHNLLDGMLLAAAYLVSIPLGFATTLAVLMHEIPQEIGDFGILVHGGLSARKALLFNLLSSLLSFLGATVTLVIGARGDAFPLALLPFTAGGFLYIAGSDLVPELHRQEPTVAESLGQLGAIVGGMALMLLLALRGS